MDNKKKINEVLDNDGNIMGKTSLGPENNKNNQTQSNKITDYNTMVGRQKFDTNFLGRFGFHFYENKKSDEKSILDKLAELEFEQYKNFLSFFVNNFSKSNLKKWVELSKKDFDSLDDEDKKSDYYNALKVIQLLKDNFKNKKDKETINEFNDIVEKEDDNDILPEFNKLIELVKTKEQGLGLLSNLIKSLNKKGLITKELNEFLKILENNE